LFPKASSKNVREKMVTANRETWLARRLGLNQLWRLGGKKKKYAPGRVTTTWGVRDVPRHGNLQKEK